MRTMNEIGIDKHGQDFVVRQSEGGLPLQMWGLSCNYAGPKEEPAWMFLRSGPKKETEYESTEITLYPTHEKAWRALARAMRADPVRNWEGDWKGARPVPVVMEAYQHA